MPRARVFVKATFVSTKAGKTPSVIIDRPDDITEPVGDIDVKGYDFLIHRITEIVKNKENGFWFRKDSNHRYHFGEFALPNGGINGLKDRRTKDSDLTSKLTASKLVPIKSPSDFERNVTFLAEVKYWLGSRSKVREPENYTMVLSVVLVKENFKKASPPPTSSIVCQSVDVATSGNLSGAASNK